jgi:hypothetical protein
MLAEQGGATAGLLARFNGAVLGVLRTRHDGRVPGAFDGRDHLSAAALGEVIGEKAAIPDDQTEGEFAVSWHDSSY